MYATSIHDGLEPDSEDCVAPFGRVSARGVRGGHPSAQEESMPNFMEARTSSRRLGQINVLIVCGRARTAEATSGCFCYRGSTSRSRTARSSSTTLKAGFLGGGFDGVGREGFIRVLGRHDKNFVFKIAKRHDERCSRTSPCRGASKKDEGDFRAACLSICAGANRWDLSGVGEAAGE